MATDTFTVIRVPTGIADTAAKTGNYQTALANGAFMPLLDGGGDPVTYNGESYFVVRGSRTGGIKTGVFNAASRAFDVSSFTVDSFDPSGKIHEEGCKLLPFQALQKDFQLVYIDVIHAMDLPRVPHRADFFRDLIKDKKAAHVEIMSTARDLFLQPVPQSAMQTGQLNGGDIFLVVTPQGLTDLKNEIGDHHVMDRAKSQGFGPKNLATARSLNEAVKISVEWHRCNFLNHRAVSIPQADINANKSVYDRLVADGDIKPFPVTPDHYVVTSAGYRKLLDTVGGDNITDLPDMDQWMDKRVPSIDDAANTAEHLLGQMPTLGQVQIKTVGGVKMKTTGKTIPRPVRPPSGSSGSSGNPSGGNPPGGGTLGSGPP